MPQLRGNEPILGLNKQQEERIAKNDSMPMQNVSLRGMI
jgi:hypothetical protein